MVIIDKVIKRYFIKVKHRERKFVYDLIPFSFLKRRVKAKKGEVKKLKIVG